MPLSMVDEEGGMSVCEILLVGVIVRLVQVFKTRSI
jgi:hypothetical protein